MAIAAPVGGVDLFDVFRHAAPGPARFDALAAIVAAAVKDCRLPNPNVARMNRAERDLVGVIIAAEPHIAFILEMGKSLSGDEQCQVLARCIPAPFCAELTFAAPEWAEAVACYTAIMKLVASCGDDRPQFDAHAVARLYDASLGIVFRRRYFIVLSMRCVRTPSRILAVIVELAPVLDELIWAFLEANLDLPDTVHIPESAHHRVRRLYAFARIRDRSLDTALHAVRSFHVDPRVVPRANNTLLEIASALGIMWNVGVPTPSPDAVAASEATVPSMPPPRKRGRGAPSSHATVFFATS